MTKDLLRITKNPKPFILEVLKQKNTEMLVGGNISDTGGAEPFA